MRFEASARAKYRIGVQIAVEQELITVGNMLANDPIKSALMAIPAISP